MASTKKKIRTTPSAPTTILALFSNYKRKSYQRALEEERHECLNHLKECYSRRGLALYLGAGVSQSIGLPSWAELLRLLTIRMMTRKVNTAIEALGDLAEEKRWQAILTIQEQVAAETEEASLDKPKLMMARSIKDTFGERLPLYVAHDMYGYSKQLRAWRARSLHSSRVKQRGPKLPTSPFLDAIVSLARAERDVIGRYTGLFLGLSMEDPNIRRLVDVTHRQYPDSVNFAILPRKKPLRQSKDSKKTVIRNLFEEVETTSFANIGVHVIWVDSFAEIPTLLRDICEGTE